MKKLILLFLCFLTILETHAQNTAILTGSNYRERSDALINQVALRQFNAQTIDTRTGFVYCAARYLQNTDLNYADSQLNILLDRAIAGDAYMHFTTFAVMETYMLCKSKLNDALKTKIKIYMQSVNFNFSNGGTYNLTLMPHSAVYLACEEWPDFVDASGRTHEAIQLFSKNILQTYLSNAFLIHNHEVDSPIYYVTNLAPFRMIADFAKDDVLQRNAFSTFQVSLAILNAGYNNGIYVANPYRSKGWSDLGDGLKNASGLNSYAWLLFGKSSDQFYYQGFSGSKGFEVFNFWLAYPGYTQPKESILQSSQNKNYPYFKKGRGFKRTYQSLNYGLATWDTPSGNPNVNYNWKESKRTYLAWQSDTITCHFSINQENPRRPSEPTIANAFGYGDNPYHRVMQHNGTAIGIWNVPLSYTFYKLYNAFPKSAFKGILHKHGWIICHTGTMMFAVKTLEPYVWDTTSNALHNLQWVASRKGSWIMETTELSANYSGNFNSQMNQYADALQANTNIVTINYSSSTPRLQYTSLQGDVLDITYFNPTVTYSNQFIINGAVDPFTNQITDDICAYQDYNSNQLQIKSNGLVIETLIKDQASQNGIVAQPSNTILNLSTTIPSPTYYWIIPDGCTFLNNTNAFSANPSIQMPVNVDFDCFDFYVYVDDGKISKRIYTQQQVIAQDGLIRFNTTNYEFEGFSNNTWSPIGNRVNVLDNLAVTAAAAYSLRKLRSAYTGPAIKVRRSSDNALVDINFTVNGVLDEIALLSFVGSSDGYVHTWYNQIANSNHLIMNTITLQPKIVVNGVIIKKGNKPGIYTNGNSRLNATALSPAISVDNCYVSIVKEHSGTTTGGVLDLGSSAGFRFAVLINSSLNWHNGGNTGVNNLGVSNILSSNVGFGVYSFISNSSENVFEIFTNSALTASKSKLPDARTSNRLRMFVSADSAPDFGTTSEVIIFRTALSKVERTIVERNQVNYYETE